MPPPPLFALPEGKRGAIGRPRLALPPLSVERMVRVDRKAIVANVVAIASLVDRPLALVAIPAERAQRAETESVPIAFVGRVMVGDRRRRDAVPPEAEGAQRLDPELAVSTLSPTLQAVPGTPGERLCWVGDAGRHGVKGSRLG
jgi:hypothetical protein